VDEFAIEQARQRPGNAVSWRERIELHLTDGQRASLDAALSSPQISARAIAAVLERWGHPVKEGTISAWRRSRVR
jgi:hypothetical protein